MGIGRLLTLLYIYPYYSIVFVVWMYVVGKSETV
jgi:hypothetical protein